MIHIGIVTHNRLGALSGLLTAPAFTAAVEAAGARVLVLSQASTDGTAAWLDAHARGYGFAAWHSTAVRSSGAARQRLVDRWIGAGLRRDDVVVFLDDDVRPVECGWLAALIEGLAQPRVAIAGARGRRITADWLTEEVAEIGPVDYVGGGWMAAAGRVFLDGGEWSAEYAHTYWEDVDLCLRVTRDWGEVVWNCGDVGLVHDHAGLTDEQARWCAENRAIARRKWGGDEP